MGTGEAKTAVTVVFLAVGGSAFDQMARSGTRTPSPPAGRVLLDLMIEPGLAHARDIESKRPDRRGYLMTANVRSPWLGPLPHNVVAGGEIVQVEVQAEDLNENMIGTWRCIAQYTDGLPQVVELDS